jgi:5'-nucleotidase
MIKQLSWRLSMLASVLAIGAGGAAAQTASCSGTLAPGSYDRVNVAAGASCTVSGTVTVTGNVTVGTGASLSVVSPAKFTVNSSLLGANAASIIIVPLPSGVSNILGSVSLTGTTKELVIENSFVGGTLSVANSNVTLIDLFSNNVGGNVLVQNNKTSGGVNSDIIQANTIGGSLVCSGNTPAPVNGGAPNTVGGSKAGQCSSGL